MEKSSALIKPCYTTTNDAVEEQGAPSNIKEIFVGLWKYLYMRKPQVDNEKN